MRIIILSFLLVTQCLALSDELKILKEDKEYQSINKRHCDTGVEHACFAQKCLNEDDEKACEKMQAKTAENLKEAKERMQKFVLDDPELKSIRAKCEKAQNKKCPEYFEAMMKAAKNSSRKQVQVFDEQCKAQDKDACYYRDVMSYGLKRLP